MVTAFDVANFFIDLSNGYTEDCMTNLRVNKLLYFAQGWHLAITGEPLFCEDFKAWQYGPVVPSIYQKYKVCGRNPIETVDDDYSTDKFSADEFSFLLDVATEYGKYSAPTLVSMSHEDGTPWHSTAENETISKEVIKKHFSACEKKLHQFRTARHNIIAGTRGTDGVIILPKELDYDWEM